MQNSLAFFIQKILLQTNNIKGIGGVKGFFYFFILFNLVN